MKARNEADKNISLKEQSIDNKLSDMERECGKKEPVPEDEIVSRNYKAEISKLEYKKAARVFNAALVDMEEMFNRYYEHLEGISDELNGQISPKLKGQMESLVGMIQAKIRNGESFDHGIPFSLNLSSSPDVALVEADLLKTYFEVRLLKIGN